jgi:Transposase DDE domain
MDVEASQYKRKGGNIMNDIITIFCDIDDFCIHFEKQYRKYLVQENENIEINFNISKTLCLSEIMTITVYFHLSNYRNFKAYYKEYVCTVLKKYFPKLVSYNRFVELMPQVLIPLLLYMSNYRLGKTTGISFIDSTTLDVCDNRRIHCHKVFKGIAQRGKSSTGWFYGFKLHITVNDKGEILSFCLTPGDTDDRNMNLIEKLTKKLFGKLFGDKGYLSQKLFETLYSKGIQLITKIKKNMKNKLMLMEDKLLLRKRAIIETINDQLKNICQIEHSRHRSVYNFIVNIISGLIAYSFLPKKPSLNIDRQALKAVL